MAELLTVTITHTSVIKEQDLADLMVTAFEGGINHWCGEAAAANPDDAGENEYLSDVIARGGDLVLYDIEEEDGPWILTREKLLNGIKMAMEHYNHPKFEDFMDNHDAEYADIVVQYALFNEIVYG